MIRTISMTLVRESSIEAPVLQMNAGRVQVRENR